jgi:hypothetical protein
MPTLVLYKKVAFCHVRRFCPSLPVIIPSMLMTKDPIAKSVGTSWQNYMSVGLLESGIITVYCRVAGRNTICGAKDKRCDLDDVAPLKCR